MTEDKFEALVSVLRHYGMVPFMEMVDQTVDRIRDEVLSIPLPTDPEKASMALYAARMKAEGAIALRNAIRAKISDVKSKVEGNSK